MLRLALAAFAALFLIVTAPAQAARVDLIGTQILVSTEPSDSSNDLQITRTSATATTVTVADTTALTAPGCTGDGTTLVSCPVPANVSLVANVLFGSGGKTVRVNGPLRSDISGGPGNDTLQGGSLADIISGDAGNDTILGGDSPGTAVTDADYLIGEAGNDTLDGQDGNDRFSGGPGGDTIRDTSTQETSDQVEYHTGNYYPDDARTVGVTVSLDGVANDGSVEDSATPGDGGFKDNVEATVTAVDGTEYADTLIGNAGPNDLSGFLGNDTITGGPGRDIMHGHAGNDTLNARDGVADQTINCNNSDSSQAEQPNTAIIDAGLETALNCSIVDGGTSAPPAPGPGPGALPPVLPGPPAPFSAALPKPAVKDVETFPVKTVKMGDFSRGSRLCRNRWCTAARVKSYLESQKLNVDFEIKQATSKALEKAVGREVEIGEVLYTDPKAGETLTSGPKRAVEVKVYEFAPNNLANCNLERPYIRVAKELFRLTDYLKGMTIDRAMDTLKDMGCKTSQYEVVDKMSTKVNDVTLTSVKVAKKKVELTVTHPPQRLRLTDVKAVIPRDRPHVPLVFSSGGELSIPDQAFLMAVRPVTESGISFANVRVALRDREGAFVTGNTTDANGVAQFGSPDALKTGFYELWAYVCDPEGDCMVGTRSIKVIKLRKDRGYLGLDGRTVSPGLNARAAQATPAEVSAIKAEHGQLAAQIITKVATAPQFINAQRVQPNGEVAKAVQTLNSAATSPLARTGMAGYYDALKSVGVEMSYLGGAGGVTDVSLGKPVVKTGVVSNGNRVATVQTVATDVSGGILTLKVGKVVFAPHGMFYVVDGGGGVVGSPQRLKVDANSPDLDLVPLQGAMAVGIAGGQKPAGLIGKDGGKLIGMDGSTLIGMDGSTLVGMDGGTLIGMDGSTLVGNDGSTLISNDGSTVIARDGASFRTPGAGLVAAGGLN